MLVGVEIWDLNDRDLQAHESAHLQMVRMILGLPQNVAKANVFIDLPIGDTWRMIPLPSHQMFAFVKMMLEYVPEIAYADERKYPFCNTQDEWDEVGHFVSRC